MPTYRVTYRRVMVTYSGLQADNAEDAEELADGMGWDEADAHENVGDTDVEQYDPSTGFYGPVLDDDDEEEDVEED